MELVNYSLFYLADEDLLERIAAQERILTRGDHTGTVVSAELINHVFELDVIQTCTLNSWASFWQLQALGTVIRRCIRSVMPTSDEGVRRFFNQTIRPRLYDDDKPPIAFLWSRDGGATIQQRLNYKPNHFVPLIPKSVFQDLWESDEGIVDIFCLLLLLGMQKS